jgi:hypothetical protein
MLCLGDRRVMLDAREGDPSRSGLMPNGSADTLPAVDRCSGTVIAYLAPRGSDTAANNI